MNIEEMLSQILENQNQMQENQKATNVRLDTMQHSIDDLKRDVNDLKTDVDEMKQDIEELKEESKITRAAANHNGEVLEKLIRHSQKFCVKASPIRQKTACKASEIRDILLIAILPQGETVCAPQA